MKLALLGIDDATLAIAAAAESGGDSIVLIDGSASRLNEAQKIAPRARMIADWENVLDANQVDAVLLAADKPSERVEQLRRLIQVGMPVVVSHPLSLSMLESYELDMIRQELPSAVVLPFLPARWHPAAGELRAMVDEAETSAIGSIEQIVLERFMAVRDRASVLQQFSRDVDLLQFIAGDATKLHALGTGGTADTGPYGNLTVQITCENEAICRWTVSPAHDFAGARLTVVGSSGRAMLSMPSSKSANENWTLDVQTANAPTRKEFPNWNPAAAALRLLSAAMAGSVVEPNWTEASRTVELAETIDRSLKRGRTIDMHSEEFTDIGTFKGTMTSVGCGILMVGMMLVVFVAMAHVVAVQAGWQKLADILGAWPYLLLGVCGLYLVLQFLPLLVGKPRDASSAKTEGG